MGGGTKRKGKNGDGGETKKKKNRKRESRLRAGAVSARGGGERLREMPVAVSHHGRRLMYAVNHCGRHLINERYKNTHQK